jgi:aminopeptidase YwaD
MPSPALGAAKFESQRALQHVRELAVNIGSRPAGSDAETRAAEYIRGELARYGYATTIQEFDFEQFVDIGTQVDVLSGRPETFQGRALGGSANGTAEADIVRAGIGRLEDFPAGTTGKIALVERGELSFGMKVNNAAAAGAAGVIVFNSESGLFVGDLGGASSIPAASLSREDGLALEALGSPLVRLQVQNQLQTVISRNVVAEPPDGTCGIVAGGHLDSVPAGPGANDNASGTAVVLEIARARAAGGQLDGVCYVLFGAEEVGLLGSAAYVESLPQAEIQAFEAMLNFDMLSVGDRWPFIGAPELTDIVSQEAAEIGVQPRILPGLPEDLGSDHFNFAQRGVPSIIFNCFCDPNYHTSDDKFEFVQESRLGQAGLIGLGMIEQLLAS